jgi:hypothetical protein
MTQIICQMMLRRVGQDEHQHVETQHRTRMPLYGDLVEITVDGGQVLGRVTRVTPPPPGGNTSTYFVQVDEIRN